jgi:hypothetical protein
MQSHLIAEFAARDYDNTMAKYGARSVGEAGKCSAGS